MLVIDGTKDGADRDFKGADAVAAQVIRQALLDLGETATGVAEQPNPANAAPEAFALAQNYPNPLLTSAARPGTAIQYQLPEASPVKIVVYNSWGKR
jgi:hypothetical protein